MSHQSSAIKTLWHRARGRSRRKNAEGQVIVTRMKPGPTLKVWAREQVKNQTSDAAVCQEWLEHKN